MACLVHVNALYMVTHEAFATRISQSIIILLGICELVS